MKTQQLFKSFGYAAALVGALTIGASSALAGGGKHKADLAGPNAASTQKDGKGFSGEKRTGGGGLIEWLKTTIVALNPTDDQKTKIKGFAEDQRQAREKWMSDHAAEIKALKDEREAAQGAKDKTKLKDLRDKAQALWATGPKVSDLLDKIRGVLTPDQQKRFDAAIQAKKDEMKGKHNFFENGPMKEGKKGDKGGEQQLNL
jgi:hypothetical protein